MQRWVKVRADIAYSNRLNWGLKCCEMSTQEVWTSQKGWTVTEVEEVVTWPRWQFSTSVLHFSGAIDPILNVSWGQGWYCPFLSVSVRNHFSWKTALRIFPIFCMNVPYYKNKKRTRRFFREKSCSLIIHENRFWPFLAIFISFGWLFLAEIANLHRWKGHTSVNSVQSVGKGH